MDKTLSYKGYVGSVSFSSEDNVYFGVVKGIRDLITYEGTTTEELETDFHNAIDDYLTFCAENNKPPECI